MTADPPMRLTVVLTHPVQYYSPWFRHIAADRPEIDLTVLYGIEPTPEQQGVGFGHPFRWDVPLREGYRSHVVRSSRPRDRVDSGSFRGLDVREIGSAVLDARPDVVLLPGWQSMTLVRALMACRRAGIPVLYRGDTHAGSGPTGWRAAAWRFKQRGLLRLFSGYLTVGSRVDEHLRSCGVEPMRIFGAPHFVDNDYFAATAAPHQTREGRQGARRALALPDASFVAAFVGKLEARKRPLDLIQAVARVNGVDANRDPMSLLIVGSGELEHACRAEADRLGVAAHFTGFLNQSDLGRAYAAADCLVLPSDWSETWGLVVNEALATGLPAVVSDRVGCAPDLVDDTTGAVSRFGDPEDLARAIAAVRAKSAGGYPYGPACRERAGHFSIEHATRGLVDASRQLWMAGYVPPEAASPRVIGWFGHMVVPGGLERMTFDVCGIVRLRGGAVHCLVNWFDSRRVTALAGRQGATWSIVSYRQPLRRRTLNPIVLAGMARDIASNSRQLHREVRRIGATHVFLPEFLAAIRTAPALLWLRFRGVRVIMRVGNPPEPGRFYRALWRHGLSRLVDLFVANSEYTCGQILEYGIPASRVRTVRNAIKPTEEPEHVARDMRRIVYVGQLIWQKGVDLLLDAVAVLVGEGRDVTLDIVGDAGAWVAPGAGAYRESLFERASRPDLAGRVRFGGWRQDVRPLLDASGVHCCPSRPEQREGFGIVVLEAKLAGVPSVVLPTGALPELVEHGVDGWVCADTSVAALVEGLRPFVSDPSAAIAAGAAARRSVARFDYAQFTDDWWSVFAPAVDGLMPRVPATADIPATLSRRH